MIRNLHTVDDDRGVSPVIGVILMVAITVILAAVIGAFVLGIGGDLQDTPQAQINIQTTDGTNISVSHNGGDAIPHEDVTLLVNGSGDGDQLEDDLTVGSSEEVDLENHGVSVGDSNVDVTLVHDPSDGILRSVTLDF